MASDPLNTEAEEMADPLRGDSPDADALLAKGPIQELPSVGGDDNNDDEPFVADSKVKSLVDSNKARYCIWDLCLFMITQCSDPFGDFEDEDDFFSKPKAATPAAKNDVEEEVEEEVKPVAKVMNPSIEFNL